ncbi:hypothetical protein [Syntrophotalea acetylenica]|uniref:Uncharacterized protein n=1 Tax=Syntrophotalea acetylenica TaxID=29542 RepID=A0A1L3GJ56_SYNAC|nr:hypothetical protein [Syntrophotalea acetylenica]APG25954.1 hypothetical protein A7E75_13770 [Syntrophotalea acetylenica]APG44022.1 hypothetical protein A6070_07795 [Syntrophotalea acetylenica]
MSQIERAMYFKTKIEEAIHLKRLGSYDDAIAIYKHLIDIDPHVPQVAEGIAKVFAVIGKYKDAHQCFGFASHLYKTIGDEEKAILCNYASGLFLNPD